MAAKWQQVAKRILAMFMRACKQHNLIEKGAFPDYAAGKAPLAFAKGTETAAVALMGKSRYTELENARCFLRTLRAKTAWGATPALLGHLENRQGAAIFYEPGEKAQCRRKKHLA